MVYKTPVRPLAVVVLKPAFSLEIEPDRRIPEPLEFRERRYVPWLMVLVDLGAAQLALALGLLVRYIAAPWLTKSIGPESYQGLVLGLLALPVANWLMGLYPGYGLGPVERLRRRVIAAAFTF